MTGSRGITRFDIYNAFCVLEKHIGTSALNPTVWKLPLCILCMSDAGVSSQVWQKEESCPRDDKLQSTPRDVHTMWAKPYV